MADHDVLNGVAPVQTNKRPSLPSVSALKAAIAGSGVAASYPTATLNASTKNDLIYICKLHSIEVAGL